MKIEDLNNLKDYKLVWSDEFDGDCLDSTKWSLSEANEEKQYEDGTTALVFKDGEKLIKLKDGKLVLSAYYDEQEKLYVSHKSVQTKDTMSFKYGYLEVRARLPFTPGALINMYALGKGAIGCDENPPYYSAMYIFGNKGFYPYFSNSISKIYENYDENHPFYDEKMPSTDWSKRAQNLGLATPDSFHQQYFTDVMEEFKTYGFLWTPEEVAFSVDGYVVTRMKLTKDFLRPSGMEGFKKPHYLRFNTNFFITEYYETNHITPERIKNQIPFEIDYVRLYQKDGEGELNVN